MTKPFSLLLFVVLPFFVFCQTSNKDNKSVSIDTSNYVKIEKVWAIPKKEFEFSSPAEIKNDTLKLFFCSPYVHIPYGHLHKKADILKSNLKHFKITDKYKSVNSWSKSKELFHTLTFEKSKLLLWFDKHSCGLLLTYILKGEIYDDETNLGYGVRVGISKEDFIKTYFSKFPTDILKKYNFIVFESCAADNKHTYKFEDDHLQSVVYECDTIWKLDY